MILLLVYLFFLMSLLNPMTMLKYFYYFVGCIVNFIVSYLICMFQDSVPTGSYNDPFLSSVCVCVCARARGLLRLASRFPNAVSQFKV